MSLKKSSSEAMVLESDLCVLPRTSSDGLQPEYCFVRVEQKDPICLDTGISSDTQISSEGAVSTDCIEGSQIKHEQVNSIHDTLMSDLIEDITYEYDYHWGQYDSTITKVSHKKKPSHKNITVPNNSPSPQQAEAFDIHMFDEPTAKILKSIASSNNYYTGNFGNIINKGRNSIVAYAYISIKDYPKWEPGAKPILMYATINNEYNKRYRNWRSEQNVVKVYKLSGNKSNNERIFQQVQRESRHLHILNKAKCKVPEMKRCSRNVIVMSLVGTDGVPAPSIKTLATQPLRHFQQIYDTIVKDIEMWYKTLHLIHGNLASRNILFWKKEVFYIGWAHSVKAEQPVALKKLMKDCCFITKFFEVRGVPVKPTERLFKGITGLKEIDGSLLSVSHSRDLWKRQHWTNPNRIPTKQQHDNSDNPGRSRPFKIYIQ